MPNEDWIGGMMNAGNRKTTLRLSQITMPMSHDAGVSKTTANLKGACPYLRWAVTQDEDIRGQLKSGSRCFDLRFQKDGNAMRTVHEDPTTGAGAWGEPVDSIFDGVRQFLGNHNGEFVILRISHTTPDAEAIVQGEQQTRLNLANLVYKPNNVNANVAQEFVSNLQGKAIVLYCHLTGNDVTNGYIKYDKVEDGVKKRGIFTCGEYAKKKKISDVNDHALKEFKRHRDICRRTGGVLPPPSDHLFTLYWQLTGGDIRKNTLAPGNGDRANADATTGGTHFNLPFLMTWLKGGHSGVDGYPAPDEKLAYWAPNLISLDFINDDVCNKIIVFNESNLRSAGL